MFLTLWWSLLDSRKKNILTGFVMLDRNQCMDLEGLTLGLVTQPSGLYDFLLG